MAFDVVFENVSKVFGEHVAVDDISFAVPAGSFFSLLGPSGCGKSTTLRMTSGFERPDAGAIRIGGVDMSDVPPYRRPTNMVFQRWALFPHMSVYDNVAFGLTVERVRGAELKRRVVEALELVDLTGFAERKPRQLSGGQMQRVALARALVKRPEVLLLDEPLGALDLKLRLQMQLELKRIQETIGTTFVYVTHDQGEAMIMSDQIAVMKDGRIEQLGSPVAIYDEPATRFVANFIGNTNLVPVAVDELRGDTARVRLGPLAFESHVVERPGDGHGTVSIRYEGIRLGDAATGCDTRASARVRDAIFSGSAVHYVVELDGAARPLTVQAPHTGGERPIAKDSVVAIGWNGRATRLFAGG